MNNCPAHHDGHHYIYEEKFEENIDRGRCKCGVYRFGINQLILKTTSSGRQGIASELLNRVAELNEKEGKKTMANTDKKPQQGALQGNGGTSGVKDEGLGILPPKPDTTGMSRGKAATCMGKYYRDNREAIKADYAAHGDIYTIIHWAIPPTTWQKGLMHDIDPEKYGPRPKRTKRKSVPLPGNNKPSLPEFPPFSDKWAPEVQLKWLEMRRELASEP